MLQNTNHNFQWVKLDKQFFGFQKDLCIWVAYFPPAMSSYTKSLGVDMFACIESDITRKFGDANILICGDCNARIGTNPDYILQDDNTFLPLFQSYPVDQSITKRKSRDVKIDTKLKELLDLCISQQLRVLNGRTLGDLQGNYTCFTPNGASVVDYTIVSEDALQNILYFKILEFNPTLSDCHCKLEWEMSANYSLTPTSSEECSMHPMPLRYIWSENYTSAFQEALSSSALQLEIDHFLSTTDMETVTNINTAASELANIFTNAADISLKKSKILKQITTKSKKWFDNDLRSNRQNLINFGKVYTKYPKDPYVKKKVI